MNDQLLTPNWSGFGWKPHLKMAFWCILEIKTEGRQSHQKYPAVSELTIVDPSRAQSVYFGSGSKPAIPIVFWATLSIYLLGYQGFDRQPMYRSQQQPSRNEVRLEGLGSLADGPRNPSWGSRMHSYPSTREIRQSHLYTYVYIYIYIHFCTSENQ